MSVLVFVEHHGNELQTGSLGVLAKAASLGDVSAVLIGGGVKALAPAAARYGAAKVYVAEDDSLEPPLPQPRVDVLAKIVEDGGYDSVLLANSVLAADIAAGLAARLDAGLNWDLIDVESRDGTLVGKRPALQDSVLVDVGWKATPMLGLFRAGSFDATPKETGQAEIVDVSADYEEHSRSAKVVDREQGSLSGADIDREPVKAVKDRERSVAGGFVRTAHL